jgi:phosphopantetheinyl transferase (holo-ACP synthase)
VTASAEAWIGAPQDVLAVVGTDSLSDDEIRVAERFRFPDDRDSYIAAHALLRRVLGSLTRMSPADLSFVSSARGKPSVARAPGPIPSFSLSHTRGAVAVATGTASCVGVDVERVDVRALEVAEVALSQSEWDDLGRLPEPDRVGRVATLWSLKESYAKATGIGLPALEAAGGMPTLSFSFADDAIELHDQIGWATSGGWAFSAMLNATFAVALAACDSSGKPAVAIRELRAWSALD